MEVSDRTQWSFPGGLPLPDHKDISTAMPIERAALPSELVFPLQQHAGLPAEPVVSVGEYVLKGQMIARPAGPLSAAVHASSSGSVTAIEERPVPHPGIYSAPCIVIATDGREQWIPREVVADYRSLPRDRLLDRIRDAGIVGLGGAGFPSDTKLRGRDSARVDTLILNGAECEPYISCDDMLMRERAADVVCGAQVLCDLLDLDRCMLAIEDNKPEADRALRAAIEQLGEKRIRIHRVPSVYPEGGERQLIQVLTGKEVPAGGLPLDLGVICVNVGTAAAVAHAVLRGEPLISRVVTVTGRGLVQPRNIEALIGTPVAALVDECGGYTDDVARLIMGGPMMGFALPTDAAPIVKTTNCIIAAASDEVDTAPQSMPCIRCGDCAVACPASLLPQQLYWYAQARDYEKLAAHHLFDCIECGCCAYVCPSHIPLVQYYRAAKADVRSQDRQRAQADMARNRFENRQQRLAREHDERAAQLARKRQALRDTPHADRAAIDAIVARSKARRDTPPEDE